MRLSFLNQYREVARLVEAPAKALPTPKGPQGTQAFGPLIGSVTTEAATSPNLPPAPKGLSNQEPMARYKFPEPEILPPSAPSRLPNSGQAAGTLKTSPGLPPSSVNPPTVLSTRRVAVSAAPTGPTLPKTDIIEIANKAGAKHGIDPMLATAVVAAESSFDPRAISNDGHESKGLMQLLDSTGKQLLAKAGLQGQYDPFHPEQNLDLGVGYLRHLHDIFKISTNLKNDHSTFAAANSASLEKLAVAAFNAGEGRVAAAQSRAQLSGSNPGDYAAIENYLPQSTQEYVRKVARLKSNLEPDFEG